MCYRHAEVVTKVASMAGTSYAAAVRRAPCTQHNQPEKTGKRSPLPALRSSLFQLCYSTWRAYSLESYGHMFGGNPPVEVELAVIFTRQDVKRD